MMKPKTKDIETLPNKNDAPKVKLTVYLKENFNIYKERLGSNTFSKIYFTYRHCL